MKRKRTVWIARCDHLGDLLATLPLLDKLSQTEIVKIIVEPYIYGFAVSVLVDIEVISSSDFCKIIKFENEDVFIPLKASKIVIEHVKKYFPGTKLGYFFRPKDWFYANSFSKLIRAQSTEHESKLMMLFTSHLFPDMVEKNDEYLKKSYLKNFFKINTQNNLRPKGFKKIVIIHPGSSSNGREWTVERWAELIKSVAKLDVDIHITGKGLEADSIFKNSSLNGLYKSYIDKHDTIYDLLAHISKSNLLISSGTGPAHLAAAIGIPVITLFPPIPKIGELRWRPIGEAVHCITAPTFSGGFCSNHRQCKNKDCSCMGDLKADVVLHKILSILNL